MRFVETLAYSHKKTDERLVKLFLFEKLKHTMMKKNRELKKKMKRS